MHLANEGGRGMFFIIFALVLGMAGVAHGFCILGEDGNYHTDEDPFIDAKNHDFRLKPGSCAIDHGATLPEVKTDFDGVSRPQGAKHDIGAYEFAQSSLPETPQNLEIVP